MIKIWIFSSNPFFLSLLVTELRKKSIFHFQFETHGNFEQLINILTSWFTKIKKAKKKTCIEKNVPLIYIRQESFFDFLTNFIKIESSNLQQTFQQDLTKFWLRGISSSKFSVQTCTEFAVVHCYIPERISSHSRLMSLLVLKAERMHDCLSRKIVSHKLLAALLWFIHHE